MLFKRSKNVDAQTLDGLTAIELAGSLGHTGLEVIVSPHIGRSLAYHELNGVRQAMLKQRRENMTLNNAKSFLAEQAAEERSKSEARAVKAAKVQCSMKVACKSMLVRKKNEELARKRHVGSVRRKQIGRRQKRS